MLVIKEKGKNDQILKNCKNVNQIQQTDTQTDHATPSVAIARILCSSCDMALKSLNGKHENRWCGL